MPSRHPRLERPGRGSAPRRTRCHSTPRPPADQAGDGSCGDRARPPDASIRPPGRAFDRHTSTGIPAAGTRPPATRSTADEHEGAVTRTTQRVTKASAAASVEALLVVRADVDRGWVVAEGREAGMALSSVETALVLASGAAGNALSRC